MKGLQARSAVECLIASGMLAPGRSASMRGQSAVEYLITYGWMLLVLVAVLAALIAVGIFNPGLWFSTQNKVTGLSSFSVTDFTVTTNGAFTIYLKSETGVATRVTAVRVNNSVLTGIAPTPPINVNPGANVTITGNSTFRGNAGDAFYNARFEIVYDVVGGGAAHTDTGIMQGRWQ